jgi:hypothetical protein
MLNSNVTWAVSRLDRRSAELIPLATANPAHEEDNKQAKYTTRERCDDLLETCSLHVSRPRAKIIEVVI